MLVNMWTTKMPEPRLAGERILVPFDAFVWATDNPYMAPAPKPHQQSEDEELFADEDRVTLAERTLIEIVKNKFFSEATRTRACQLILEREDTRKTIEALQDRIAALESKQSSEDFTTVERS